MESQCPLCGRGEKYMRRGKPLYGQKVCKKCYYGFANRRQLAFVVDIVLFRVLGFMLGVVLGIILLMGGVADESLEVMLLPVGLMLSAMFFCKDGFSGFSPGKAICGVRALDRESGEPIGFGTSLKRNLPLLIPFMPIVVAVQLTKGRRWGDGWARSQVIWIKYANQPVFAVGSPREQVEPEADAARLAELASLPPVAEGGNPYQAPRT